MDKLPRIKRQNDKPKKRQIFNITVTQIHRQKDKKKTKRQKDRQIHRELYTIYTKIYNINSNL